MQAVYLNPLTDVGFKKLFGEEQHKDLLISFLNTLLPEHHQIADLQYTKNEYQGITPLDRNAIFDLNCRSQTGEHFVVELQKVKQVNFKDRSIYYSSFGIQAQAQRDDWNYQLEAVYTIGILDFLINDDEQEVLYHAQLKDQSNRVFYDKLNFIYLLLPRFIKTAEQLASLQDKWLYVLKHLHELETLPAALNETIFHRTFAIAQLSQFDAAERQVYEDSVKYYRDLKHSFDTAHQEGLSEGLELGRQEGLALGRQAGLEAGRQEGLHAGRLEGWQDGLAEGQRHALVKIVHNLNAQSLSIETIAQMTDLTTVEVELLLHTKP
jgi:predicted transposase/invertase (TIGR01784 family)